MDFNEWIILSHPEPRDPFYQHGLTLIPVWIRRNQMLREVWDEITYAFPNFNGCTVEVWVCISNFTPGTITDVMITHPCRDEL